MGFSYTPRFIEEGKVGVLIGHPNPKNDELLVFDDYDDMEACAISRPYIPVAVWETLSEMYRETQAKHNPVHVF
ncbi:MAG: hypothetical protein PHF20_01310 [Halothiobacillaceae bacterium]|nr:hypothetical protein [Halothiobacillaceae bacterium]